MSATRPLLDGGGGGGETSRGGRKPFNRRSDAIAYGSPYQKAAALVDLVSNSQFHYYFISSILHPSHIKCPSHIFRKYKSFFLRLGYPRRATGYPCDPF